MKKIIVSTVILAVLTGWCVIKEQKNSNFTFEFETGEFGAYITSVNGKMADSLKNEYFAFYLNGEYAALGISEQAVLDGDQIKLVLETW